MHRFHSIAVCSLTALVAGGLTAHANEAPSSSSSSPEPVANDSRTFTSTVVPTLMQPIAAPESLAIQPLAQSAVIQSGQEATIQPSASIQPVSVTPVKPAETAATTTSPVLGAETTAETLRPAEAVAPSVTPKTNPLVVAAEPQPTQPTKVCSGGGGSGGGTNQLAQATRRCPRPQPVAPIEAPQALEDFGASPALSIAIPVGYGADRNTLFLSGSYQASVREDEGSVGAAGVGIGLGNADKSVGVELSYALETTDDEFGEGGFNAKVHKRFRGDVGAALGWDGILNLGRNDFEQSKYGVVTKVFRTRESVNQPLSRVAVTLGVGDGRFRSNGAVDAGENNINVFGNVAVRVARPVSVIAEWTGQDLGLGVSIAPFKRFPFVITPAVRDIAGAGDGARFVLGAGTAFQF